MKTTLLTRDEFRTKGFERDGYKCVFCSEPAILDANGIPTNLSFHHIMERRLFTAPEELGGYYLDNGATVCETHHRAAETTELSTEAVRAAAGIEHVVLPEHFYSDVVYDKWGNIILGNGMRLRGDLFEDESVQGNLLKGGFLNDFSKYVKYPRTYHLIGSNPSSDDRLMNGDEFDGEYVIASLKQDGENTTMYSDFIHARSLDSEGHPSQKFVKGMWGRINYMIDGNMRVCGENLYAQHTVHYDSLDSYFNVFSIWFDQVCASWEDTKFYTELLGFKTVPVIYEGIYDFKKIMAAFQALQTDPLKNEGFVVRKAGEFTYGQFRRSVGKYVTKEFKKALEANMGGHWKNKPVVPNKLIST